MNCIKTTCLYILLLSQVYGQPNSWSSRMKVRSELFKFSDRERLASFDSVLVYISYEGSDASELVDVIRTRRGDKAPASVTNSKGIVLTRDYDPQDGSRDYLMYSQRLYSGGRLQWRNIFYDTTQLNFRIRYAYHGCDTATVTAYNRFDSSIIWQQVFKYGEKGTYEKKTYGYTNNVVSHYDMCRRDKDGRILYEEDCGYDGEGRLQQHAYAYADHLLKITASDGIFELMTDYYAFNGSGLLDTITRNASRCTGVLPVKDMMGFARVRFVYK